MIAPGEKSSVDAARRFLPLIFMREAQAFTGQGVLDANDGGMEVVFRSQFQLVL